MSTVTLDYEQMRAVAARMKTKEQSMATALASLTTIADGLVTSDFKTVHASQAFSTKVTEVVGEMGKAITSVTSFADFLRNAADAYHNADKDIASHVGGGDATSTLRVNMDEISALTTNLASTQTAFKDIKQISDSLDRDVLGHRGLADAVHDFTSEWDSHRKDIIANVDDLHQALAAVVTGFTDVDTKLNSGLQGKGD